MPYGIMKMKSSFAGRRTNLYYLKTGIKEIKTQKDVNPDVLWLFSRELKQCYKDDSVCDQDLLMRKAEDVKPGLSKNKHVAKAIRVVSK
jgi:hypothetical protein